MLGEPGGGFVDLAAHAGSGDLPALGAGERDDLVGDLAGPADRTLDQVGQAVEGADDLVAPAGLLGLVVVARVAADLCAEDVRGELLEVLAVQDEAVALVHVGELAAASAEEEQVGDEHRAGKDRGGEAVGARQVVPLEHLVPQRDLGSAAAGQEAARDEEHAEPVRGEQVKRAPQEVGVGVLLAVGAVGVLGDGHAALTVGRVRDHEAEPAGVLRAVLADPALEGAVEHGQVGSEGLEHPGRQLRPLDDEPAQILEARACRGLDEAADAGGGLQGQDLALGAGQVSDERPHDAGHLAGDAGGGVVLVGEYLFA